MANGVNGLHGSNAVNHVVKVCKKDIDNVIVLHLNMVGVTVWAVTQIISLAMFQTVRVSSHIFHTETHLKVSC